MEQQSKEKSTWGGARKGAGRPRRSGAVKTITLNLPEDVAPIVDAQPNRTAFVVEALREYIATHNLQ